MTAAPLSAMPWPLDGLWKVGLANAFGAVAVVVSWFGAAGSAVVAQQVNWVLLGVGGVAVLAVADCMWLLVGRRAVGLRRRAVLRPLAAFARPSGNGTGDPANTLVWEVDQPRWVPGTRHYHRPQCQLVVGKDARTGTIAEHELAGRTACGMCQP